MLIFGLLNSQFILDKWRRHANNFTTVSTFLSALAGLGVWPIFLASTALAAVITVSVVSLASAVVAQYPKIKGYSKCAEDSAILSSRYGNVLGELKDSLEMLISNHHDGQVNAYEAIKTFEEIKKEKDALKPYPEKLQEKINKIRASKTH